jgi:hypothetical protein
MYQPRRPNKTAVWPGPGLALHPSARSAARAQRRELERVLAALQTESRMLPGQRLVHRVGSAEELREVPVVNPRNARGVVSDALESAREGRCD